MKKLLLRIDCSKYSEDQLKGIVKFFSKFFLDVEILDIVEQKIQINELVTNSNKLVVSLDKFIPLEYNLDISRVFNLEGDYLFHNIKFPGKMINHKEVILYDHDVVGGFGINLGKTLLEYVGCDVEIFALYRPDKDTELLDLADFTGESGLVVQIDNVLKRIPYHTNPVILEDRAGIPAELFNQFREGFQQLYNKGFLK